MSPACGRPLRSVWNWPKPTMGTTYRRTVVLYRDLFPGRPCPSFQSLHRFAKRVSIQELKDLQAQLKKRLLPFLPKGESAPPLILDSTGLSIRGPEAQVTEVRGHSRLCCLMRHLPERWFRTGGPRWLAASFRRPRPLWPRSGPSWRRWPTTSGCSSPSLCLYPGSSRLSSLGPSIRKTSPEGASFYAVTGGMAGAGAAYPPVSRESPSLGKRK